MSPTIFGLRHSIEINFPWCEPRRQERIHSLKRTNLYPERCWQRETIRLPLWYARPNFKGELLAVRKNPRSPFLGSWIFSTYHTVPYHRPLVLNPWNSPFERWVSLHGSALKISFWESIDLFITPIGLQTRCEEVFWTPKNLPKEPSEQVFGRLRIDLLFKTEVQQDKLGDYGGIFLWKILFTCFQEPTKNLCLPLRIPRPCHIPPSDLLKPRSGWAQAPSRWLICSSNLVIWPHLA